MHVNGRPQRTIWLSPDDPSIVQIIDQRALPHDWVVADLRSYRDGVVAFEQAAALGDLSVRWVGPDDESDAAEIADRAVTDEFKGAAGLADAQPEEAE